MARRNYGAVVPREGVLSVFTDGSSTARGRHGGIGIRFVYCDRDGNEDVWDQVEDGYQRATGNEMELVAVITALRAMQHRSFRRDLVARANKIEIFTDSSYVAENIGNASFYWPGSGWMTKDGNPVESADLWKQLVREYQKLRAAKPAEIKWAKGHSKGNPHNAAADKLAKSSAHRHVRAPVAVSTVRRKRSTRKLERGSVEMLGQRVNIHIVAAKHLRTQRLSRYTYEVVSPGSRFFECVDIAYSDDARMRPGHTYLVSMNRDSRAPRIARCHSEVLAEREGDASSP